MELDIKIGQMVEVPFRNKKVEGIIIEIKKQRPSTSSDSNENKEIRRLKPIIKILDEKPILYPRQIEALNWIAEYYYAPLALVLKTFAPDVPKTKNQDIKISRYQDIGFKLTVLKSRLPEIKKAIDEIINSQKNVLFQWNDLREKITVYIKLAEHCIREKKQILIILPQITDVEFLHNYLYPQFRSKIVLLHAQLAKTACYNNWTKIRGNKAKIILGTRSAILAPMKNPELIIIDDEEASDHKQSDMNPRYDVRKIAEKLGVKVMFASKAPRIDTRYQIQDTRIQKNFKFQISNFKLEFVKLINQKTAVELIDMVNELSRDEYSPISLKMEERMKETLEQGEKVVLFLNRKGTATMAVCKDCNYLYKCPHCNLPFAYHETEKQLICHHCGFKTDAPLTCPACKGHNIKFPGTGTQKIEQEARKLFPDKKIIRIDKDASYYRLDIAKYDIIIGTQLFFKLFPNLENVGLVGIVSSDALLHRPSFRSCEKTFQMISKILVWAGFNKAKQVLIQSYTPEHYSIRYAVAQNYDQFFEQEIESRRQLGYPPFIKLIKLIYKNENQNQGVSEAERLANQLQKIKSIQVIGPASPYVSKIRGRFHQEIILKTSLDFKLPIAVIPNNWLIDVEPEEIL
ncbi:primosomal protein N' [Candidatus Parcubacteria bacterium]|nr:primosomal protein N' [Candidatus Parcubacteria bacterium]